MKDCCLSMESRSYYNNLAYHLSKMVVNKYMNKKENSSLIDLFDNIISDLDDIFPSEDNQWNYMFERKLIELGFFYEEDKKKVKEIKAIYEKKKRESFKEREKSRGDFNGNRN